MFGARFFGRDGTFKEIELYNEVLSIAVPCDLASAARDEVDMLELKCKTVLALGDGHCLRDQALGFALLRARKMMNALKPPV